MALTAEQERVLSAEADRLLAAETTSVADAQRDVDIAVKAAELKKTVIAVRKPLDDAWKACDAALQDVYASSEWKAAQAAVTLAHNDLCSLLRKNAAAGNGGGQADILRSKLDDAIETRDLLIAQIHADYESINEADGQKVSSAEEQAAIDLAAFKAALEEKP